MAAPKSLTVVIAPNATAELAAIWRWNAEHYSPDHADRYLAFLETSIYDLDRAYPLGRSVDTRPELRHILIRRKTQGHGHVAVYRVTESTVDVVHLFHSAQDWQKILIDEQPSH